MKRPQRPNASLCLASGAALLACLGSPARLHAQNATPVAAAVQPARLAGPINLPPPPNPADDARNQLQPRQHDLEAATQRAATEVFNTVSDLARQQQQQLEQARLSLVSQQKSQLDAQRARVNARILQPSGQTQGNPILNNKINTGGSTPPTVLSQPRLATLDHSSGQPDEWVLFSGANFTPGCKVGFQIAAGVYREMPAEVWNSGSLVAQVPHVVGLPDYNGQVTIKRADGQTSESQPFAFRAMRECRVVDADLVMGSSVIGRASSTLVDQGVRAGSGAAYHVSYGGAYGTDNLGGGVILKNGWSVAGWRGNIASIDQTSGVVRFTDTLPNTNQILIKAEWTTRPWFSPLLCESAYALGVYAVGPMGVPYK